MEYKLIEIYKQRKQDCIRLLNEGKSFDEMQAAVQHYQDEIDAILPKKKDEEVETTKVNNVLRILGLWTDCRNNDGYDAIFVGPETTIYEGGKLLKTWCGPTINKKAKYARILIKKLGYEYYDEDGVLNAVLDNADEEDINWYKSIIKNKIENI